MCVHVLFFPACLATGDVTWKVNCDSDWRRRWEDRGLPDGERLLLLQQRGLVGSALHNLPPSLTHTHAEIDN